MTLSIDEHAHPTATLDRASAELLRLLDLEWQRRFAPDPEDFLVPDGVGYRFNGQGQFDPNGAYDLATLRRLGRLPDPSPALTALYNAHLLWLSDQEEGAPLAWLGYLDEPPVEHLALARAAPLDKLLATREATTSLLIHASPSLAPLHAGGTSTPSLPAEVLPAAVARAIARRERERAAWARANADALRTGTAAVLALEEFIDQAATWWLRLPAAAHLDDPWGLVDAVRQQLAAVGRDTLADRLSASVVARGVLRIGLRLVQWMQANPGGALCFGDAWDTTIYVLTPGAPRATIRACIVQQARELLVFTYTDEQAAAMGCDQEHPEHAASARGVGSPPAHHRTEVRLCSG